MIGNTFGDFLVLKKYSEPAKDKCIQYYCQCIHCQNIEIVASNVLRSQKKHCSNCYTKKTTLIDLTNQTFGYLQVLTRDLSETHTGHENDAYWICKCLKCGSIKSVRGIALRKGTTQSCGCVRSRGEEKIAQLLSAHNIIFEREYSFPDCFYNNKKNKMRFDFAIFNNDHTLSHLIEYDGIQHFEDGVRDSGWNTYSNYQKVKKRDQYKNEYCNKHNIKLIRIKYDEEITLEKLLGEDINGRIK